MATIDFSIPLWDTCKAHTSYEAYEYLKKAQEHSDEAKEDKFSRFQTTAYLLLSVAMTFFHGLSVEAQALGEGTLYYFSDETESAKDVFTEKGKEGLKTLGFSLYQLFLACVALLYPSEVESRLTLPKPVELKPGLLSDDPEEINNYLMLQNGALRHQISLLKGQLGVDSSEIAVNLLEENQRCEERLERATFKAEQDLAFQESLVIDTRKQLEETKQILAHQKEQDQEKIEELEENLKTTEHFWRYFQHALEKGELKGKPTDAILGRLRRVWDQPHFIRDYKFD